jgi:hypothetical protein
VDVRFASGWPWPIRLYYSPNGDGAWVCIPPDWSGNLAGYYFNNDSSSQYSGYEAQVENDVASSKASTGGSCSNPITNE